MPRRDLRALFRTNVEGLDAVYVFANREDERIAFDSAFAAHQAGLDDPVAQVGDMTSPRSNVLTFYGVGGIGKTSLSRQLQARVESPDESLPEGWPAISEAPKVLTARLDLSREAGHDFESMILLLRAALAPLGRPMTAFDLAFARYWERNHSEPLADYMSRHGFFSRLPGASAVPQHLSEAVTEVIGLAGMGVPGLPLLVQTGPGLVAALRDRSRRRHALKDCRRLPDLLEADASLDSLSFYPHLLAWDLASWQRREPIGLVVFIDTFEQVGSRSDRDLERLIQRMVWLMPNAMFVVTGRNRLDWDDPGLADRLDWTGSVSWPGLAAGTSSEPRQHLVGFLSPRDCDRYLRTRLIRDGQPAIPADIRQRIVANSRGLPLYLDLSVMRFLHLLPRPEAMTPDDFSEPFPGIVARVFRDLDQAERSILRAVTLLDAFDVDLALVTAGVTSRAAAQQLVQRPLVLHAGDGRWPYYLHDLVREQVRVADVGLDDSWTPQDWSDAAARALIALGRIAVGSRLLRDRRTLISVLNQGFRLAHEYRLQLDWLVDAAYWYVEDSVWEPTLRPRVSADIEPDRELQLTTPAQTLAVALETIAKRQRVHRGETLRLLERCAAADGLGDQARDLIAYFHAECQRDLGHPAESEREMLGLIGPNRRMADAALRGLSHLQRRTGRFAALASQLQGRPLVGVWHRATGELHWTQGRLDDACREYDAGIAWASEERLPGEIALTSACRAWAASLMSAEAGRSAIDAAREALRSVTIAWAELLVACAEAACRAGEVDAEQLCDQLVSDARQRGLTSPEAYAQFARAFHFAVLADVDGLLRARALIRSLVHGHQFAYLCEIVDFWLGTSAPDDGLPAAQWVDERDVTAGRWLETVQSRRRDRQALRSVDGV
ncbi:hypothetical protein ACLQ3E_05245 [Micromonospora trifolii]